MYLEYQLHPELYSVIGAKMTMHQYFCMQYVHVLLKSRLRTEPKILTCHISESSFIRTPSLSETGGMLVNCASLENLEQEKKGRGLTQSYEKFSYTHREIQKAK